MQPGKRAVYGQTSYAERGRVLAVTFISSYGFDFNLPEIGEFGGNDSILTFLDEFLLLYSVP